MADNNTHKLAEKIARILEGETRQTDHAALFASIEKLNHRIDKLEAALSVNAASAEAPAHPSVDRFAVAEAIANEIFSSQKDKACTFEPNGKPCDHCAMCSSRGF
jgi:hypothetical protein